MARSRIPLVALMGAMGCTQDASTLGVAPSDDDTSLLQRLKGEDTGKGGSSIRGLSDEERRSLIPRPLPVPEGWKAPEAAAAEPRDGGSEPTDYAEQRRQFHAQRMQQLQRDAALRDAGVERTAEEKAADADLALGPVPEDIAGQRRQQIAKERVETERYRKYGKGGGIKRREIIQIIRPTTDGGTTVHVKE